MARTATTPTPAAMSDLHLIREVALAAELGGKKLAKLVAEAESRGLHESQVEAWGHALLDGDHQRAAHAYRPTTPVEKLQHRLVVLSFQLRREQARGDQCAADLTQGEMYGLRFALEALGAPTR